MKYLPVPGLLLATFTVTSDKALQRKDSGAVHRPGTSTAWPASLGSTKQEDQERNPTNEGHQDKTRVNH